MEHNPVPRYSRDVLQSRFQFGQLWPPVAGLTIRWFNQREVRHHEPVRIPAVVDLIELLHSPDEHTRTRQKNQCESNLTHHQRMPQSTKQLAAGRPREASFSTMIGSMLMVQTVL